MVKTDPHIPADGPAASVLGYHVCLTSRTAIRTASEQSCRTQRSTVDQEGLRKDVNAVPFPIEPTPTKPFRMNDDDIAAEPPASTTG